MDTVMVTILPDGWARVTFDFDPDIIVVVKGVGRGNYKYSPAEHNWYVREHRLPPLIAALKGRGLTVYVGTKPKETPNGAADSRGVQAGNPYDTILGSLPYPLALNFYRAAAKVLHPDNHGGDLENMKLLNIAWGKRDGKK